MDEFSIETRAQNIFDRKTKEYFSEVLSSYQHGNFRSATVMLWAIVVCDLLYKLKYLVDMYGDETAKDILNTVGKMQRTNPRSSDWESKLLNLIAERTNLVEISDVENLKYLQQQRHLAAHPVLSKDLELHQPNKDTVRALIRNVLDGVLTKPPIYTRKIFNEFLDDLARSSTILITDEQLQSYIESKYLSKTNQQLELSIIRSLWKLVFRVQNADCDKNRDINFRALRILVERNKVVLLNRIRSEKDYYSNIAKDGDSILYLTDLLSKYPEFYTELTEDAKVIIRHSIETNTFARCVGWFEKGSLTEHANDLIVWIESDSHPKLSEREINAIISLSDSLEWEDLCKFIFNAYYGASWSYDQANDRFSLAIEPFIENYKKAHLLDLLKKIESNSQTFDRRRARYDHKKIKDQCDRILGDDFNYEEFPNFIRSLE